MNTLQRWFLIALFALGLLAAGPTTPASAADLPADEVAPAVIDLAAQTEHDAAQAVTTDDINQRIDNSEATTLRLSDDIGVMADRIGEMADRILWTEGQIGVMADRIVESEYLINTGAQQSADQVQESTGQLLP